MKFNWIVCAVLLLLLLLFAHRWTLMPRAPQSYYKIIVFRCESIAHCRTASLDSLEYIYMNIYIYIDRQVVINYFVTNWDNSIVSAAQSCGTIRNLPKKSIQFALTMKRERNFPTCRTYVLSRMWCVHPFVALIDDDADCSAFAVATSMCMRSHRDRLVSFVPASKYCISRKIATPNATNWSRWWAPRMHLVRNIEPHLAAMSQKLEDIRR